ncbi:MAG: hypothetical protein ACI80V_003098 [Rhodothermales bacterium]|jgi:hypothetical protein
MSHLWIWGSLCPRRQSVVRTSTPFFGIFLLCALLPAGCNTPPKQQSAVRLPVAAAPPPGSVRFLGTALNCSLDPGPLNCTIEVTNVLEYGSGAPSLPPGTRVTATVGNNTPGLKELSTESGILPSSPLEYFAQVSTVQGPDGAKVSWKIVSISRFPTTN